MAGNADFLSGGGELGALMRARDWSASPLGAPGTWPQSLRAVVALMLNSRFPMFIAWGPELAFLYNDAYAPMFGIRHPGMLGMPFREGWSDIWDSILPLVERALNGEATFDEDMYILMHRNGYPEDTWYSFSYSPVRDETGQVAGMFCACMETTQKVLVERRQAAEREQLHQMLKQMPGFVTLLSGPEHRFEYVNDAYVKLAGQRQFIGRTVREVFPEIVNQGFFELLDRVYAGGEPFTVETMPIQLDREDGERFIDFIYHPMRDDGGAVTGIFVGGYDVTDRVKAERARAASDARYRALFEAVDSGFCIVEVDLDAYGGKGDYRVIEANPGFWEQSGWYDIMGKWLRAAAPELEEHWYERYTHVARTGQSNRFQEGSELLGRWFDLYAFRIEDQDKRLVAILFQDVSARHKAENELRQLNETLERRVGEALAARKLLADIVDGTDAFVQVVSPDFRWLAINKAAANEFERIFGVRPSVGASMLELLEGQPEHQAAVRAIWQRALDGEEFTQIGEFGDPARDRRFYEMKFNQLRDRDGNRVGAYQFVYDVTQRLRDQERLKLAEDGLRHAQKMESLGQLTGGVAHDFNNLLAVVLSGLQLMDRVKDETRLQQIKDAMRHAVERGTSLTRQLLTFSRRQALDPEPLALGPRIEGMRDLLERSLGPSVAMTMEFPPDVWPVEVDAGELELAVLNLCVNARDAMPSGGTITIAAENAAGEMVRLRVADTGTGMPAHVAARAFEPFFTTKEVGKGSGLGLAQVYGFAAQSRGRVEIDSVEGKGTAITLFLPRTGNTPVGKAPEPPQSAMPGSGGGFEGHVLLVEDDSAVATLSKEMLASLGFKVTHVPTAPAALAALAGGNKVSIVLSDIMMPGGMSGMDLARALRVRHPRLPVVLTTGFKDSAAGAEDSGFSVLLKPYGIEQMRDTLQRALKANAAAPA